MLHQYEKIILAELAKSGGSSSQQQLCESTRLNPDAISKAAYWLCEKKLVQMDLSSRTLYSISQEGQEFAKKGFPEMRVLLKADSGATLAQLADDEKKIGLARALQSGWLSMEPDSQNPQQKRLTVTPKGQLAMKENPLSKAVNRVLLGNEPTKSEVGLLAARGVLVQKQEKAFALQLTKEGSAEAKNIKPEETSEINQLTREMLISGSWKGSQFREYNVSAPGDEQLIGKRHMINSLQERVRAIFTQMGFEEMEGEIMEGSFWNFDALFQPQDHPARELADTFYVKGSSELPEATLVQKVKKSHEKGWKYSWQEAPASKKVLRTHTTAVSARYLVKECQKGSAPRKFFSIGKVFRNEATDYKHLAEFYQVEGIVVDEKANFSQLLGLLRTFYAKLGFSQIRFRPSFFPYTEPSLEIEVYFEEKKQWFELGGAGIFRPEVSLPLCGRYPVLAWGLSLERPLMLLNDINDIRSFYKNNVGWLRGAKLG